MRVEIERLAFGGKGIAREDGKVLFVEGGLPRDILDVKIIKDKGSYGEAVIHQIITPSPDRVEPPCPVFGICGGCQLQNLSYPAQLREKRDILRETIQRIGGIQNAEVEEIFSSSKEYGYRTRVLLSAWFYAGQWHIGYSQERSSRKVKIESCPVSDEIINEAIARLSQVLSSVGDPNYPLDKVHISSNGSSAYISLVPRYARKPGSLGALVKHLKRFPETENVSVTGKDEAGFEAGVSGFSLFTAPSVFAQSNPSVNEAMIETVLKRAELSGEEAVLDLYSGTGNFSIPLARLAEKVVSVEVNKKAVAFAKKNATVNGISNIVFENASCEEFLRGLDSEGGNFQLVVLDPPREGAKKIISAIADLSPEKIIYVSCDPSTLARDLKKFGESGFEPISVKPFDMFPQTYHIESVSLLTKVRR
ncbi:MAG: class I SAM-dependent RNA methyltransferase [Deltaproteobacteria bacterium]